MFITLDGPDGSGKTTAARRLCERLSARYQVLLTTEPTSSPTGRRIRDILASGQGEDELTELFILDRAQHLQDEILPALAKDTVVICDRYLYSTLCYQSLRGEDIHGLYHRHEGSLRPDAAFLLLPPDVSLLLERIQNRGEARDIFEGEETLRRVTECYRSLSRIFPNEPIIYLDCSQSAEKMAVKMEKHIIFAK